MAGLQKLVDVAVAAALEKFAAQKLLADELAVTLVDLRDLKNPARAHHRGDAPVYPASVVKLFYLAAAHRQLEDGIISDTPELRRALHDMIVHSGNEATGYVLDVLTGTTSGPELPPAELAAWHEKRNAVNRYFHFKIAIPCHYLTFPVLAQSPDEFVRAVSGSEVWAPKPGEAREF